MRPIWTIASTPDNVPIVALLPLVVFFCWMAFRQARANDKLIEQLEADPALAKTHHRKTWPFKSGWQKEIHVWPFLLRVEFLAAIIVTIILMVWSITLSAPLEEPANPNLTMNPAKAPWYFLGLQEMVSYSAFMGGVGIPTVVVLGLVVAAVIKSRRAVKPITVTTDKAAVRNITHLVTATGKVQPEIEVGIAPEVSGELIALPFKEGQTVKKGDVIVKIKPDFYLALVAQQEAALASARAASLLAQASKAAPLDPRASFWNGFAAATRQPPDTLGAEQGYREALKPQEVERTGIGAITPEDIARARQLGKRWKLVCTVRREGSTASAERA